MARMPRKTEMQCLYEGVNSVIKDPEAASDVIARFLSNCETKRYKRMAETMASDTIKMTAVGSIWCSFVWSETPEGHRYWKKVVDLLEK